MTEPTPPPGDDGSSADPEVAELVRRLSASQSSLAKRIKPLPQDAVERITKSIPMPERERTVIPLFGRGPSSARTAWVLAAAAVLAAALTALFLIGRRPLPERTAYALELRGDATQRSNDPNETGPITLRPTTRLRAKLTPVTPVRDALVRVLVVRDGHVQLVFDPPRSNAEGSVVVDAEARAMLGKQIDGPAEIVFLVGREMPDDEVAKRMALDASIRPGRDFAVVRREILFKDWPAVVRTAPPVPTNELLRTRRSLDEYE